MACRCSRHGARRSVNNRRTPFLTLAHGTRHKNQPYHSARRTGLSELPLLKLFSQQHGPEVSPPLNSWHSLQYTWHSHWPGKGIGRIGRKTHEDQCGSPTSAALLGASRSESWMAVVDRALALQTKPVRFNGGRRERTSV
jgi:hypothetical protein